MQHENASDHQSAGMLIRISIEANTDWIGASLYISINMLPQPIADNIFHCFVVSSVMSG